MIDEVCPHCGKHIHTRSPSTMSMDKPVLYACLIPTDFMNGKEEEHRGTSIGAWYQKEQKNKDLIFLIPSQHRHLLSKNFSDTCPPSYWNLPLHSNEWKVIPFGRYIQNPDDLKFWRDWPHEKFYCHSKEQLLALMNTEANNFQRKVEF